MTLRRIRRIRKPVRRAGSDRYILLTLLSFAASVSLTRLFLELSGYPQLGNSELHIAHVLWGGLLLYIAALFPLLYANRWALITSAILSGTGVGLFMDEVGKFITQSNDYFYPPAAPIIYAFFLLSVLLYIRVSRESDHDVRSELYHILDGLEEVLDHDLSSRERQEIMARLGVVYSETNHPDIQRLVTAIQNFIATEDIYLALEKPSLLKRLQGIFLAWEEKYVNRPVFTSFIVGSLVALGVWALFYPFLLVLNLPNPGGLETLLADLLRDRSITNQTGLNWFGLRLALQSAIGIVLMVAAGLFVAGQALRATQLAYLGLLLSLTIVNLLIFYFDQFSTILLALIQFAIFLLVLRYRRKYFPPNKVTEP